MDNFPWEITLAITGILIAIFAFLWEFVFVGRKRLGYRVQMDTTASDEITSQNAEAWQQLLQQKDGRRLVDPSFVLLRIENTGTTNIDESDYAVLNQNKVGIRVNFPGRRVAGMVVTEISDEFLRGNFGSESGLGVEHENADPGASNSVIALPKVPLNPNQHYKVLAVLERAPGSAADHRTREPGVPPAPWWRFVRRAKDKDVDGRPKVFADPEVVGGIKGGLQRGSIQKTKSQTGTSRLVFVLIWLLVLVSLAEPAVMSRVFGRTAPLDCATGRLTLTGSTAFGPVLQEAAEMYANTCPGADFTYDLSGSLNGLGTVNTAGEKQAEQNQAAGKDDGPEHLDDMLAFSDGAKPENQYPQLLPRPLAFSLFTLVVNKQAGVHDLSLQQIRDLYDGKYVSWEQVHGRKGVPVRLVSRAAGSGTRNAFFKRIVGLGWQEPGDNSDNCEDKRAPGAANRVVRCVRSTTGDVLDTVAQTPGALGYGELGAAGDRRDDLVLVRISGHAATLEDADHGVYPFWETEYAYTYGEPSAGSLAASFLRYLTNEVGKDIVRAHGHRPCAELQNPVLCRPLTTEPGAGADAAAERAQVASVP